MTIEERPHPEGTPQGGVRTVTVYTDDDGAEVDRAAATHALVSEYDADGRWRAETVLKLDEEARRS
jgi:hypothetical protein